MKRPDGPPALRVLDGLPRGVKRVRDLSSGASVLECSHPEEYREQYTLGPRVGHSYCGLCRADDLLRTCYVLAIVRVPAVEDPQGALF